MLLWLISLDVIDGALGMSFLFSNVMKLSSNIHYHHGKKKDGSLAVS